MAFSHGGGALGAILGRLDTGFKETGGYPAKVSRSPSEQAQDFFYDSNVLDPVYLRYLATKVVPGRVFGGTDYPYDIMQREPARWVREAGLDAKTLESVSVGAASLFLDEDLKKVILG